MTDEPTQELYVLVAEDNPIDARLISRALKAANGWKVSVNVLDDGEKAISYFHDETLPAQSIPDFVILDLNLPKRDGGEVLKAIRHAGRWAALPVFVLSSSPLSISQEQIARSGFHADAFFVTLRGRNLLPHRSGNACIVHEASPAATDGLFIASGSVK